MATTTDTMWAEAFTEAEEAKITVVKLRLAGMRASSGLL
jgi:hypothetical protein